VGLTQFAESMSDTSLGVFYICTHADSLGSGMGVEYYAHTPEGRDCALDAWLWYLSHGYGPGMINVIDMRNPGDSAYVIVLTWVGLDSLCTNLTQTLVYFFGCHSYLLAEHWHAMTYVGFTNFVPADFRGDSLFWQRMDGAADNYESPTGYVNQRRVSQALIGIFAQLPDSNYSWLDFNGNGNVVVSPAVSGHAPWHYDLIGQNGYVEFDCELRTDPDAEDVVMLTGVCSNGPHLERPYWPQANNHRINFTIPDLDTFCWADFLVDPAHVMSLYNGIHLDGNTNPPNRNSTGPNGDFYNWTGRVCNLPIIDFENGIDRQPIETDILELSFPDTHAVGHPTVWWRWRYGKTTQNSNVYPYYNNPPFTYPHWWVDGDFAAWIGDAVQEHMGWYVSARIYFNYATASSVCLGYSLDYGTNFRAYDVSDSQVFYQWRPSNSVVQNMPTSHSLGQIRVLPPNGELMSCVSIYTPHNSFGIDNVVVNDVLRQGMSSTPPGYEMVLGKIDLVVPNGDSKSYPVQISQIVDSLHAMINWRQLQGLEMELSIRNPQGETVFHTQSATPPIVVDPIIADPPEGEWILKVGGHSQEHIDNYPFAVIANVAYEPLVDAYTEGETDIKWFPNLPELGDRIYICATVHAGNQFDKSIDYLPVRCYLGNPDQGIRIDIDEYVFDLVTGGADSVYFRFETEECEGIPSCQIYIVIDPENVIEEYDENNNIASREITFSE